MANLYDQAYDLEKTVRESDEFNKLTTTYEEVMNNEEAKELFEKFRNTQISIQEKQLSGAEVSENEMKAAELVVQQVQGNSLIQQLIEAEQRMNLVLTEISQIITKPLEELYEKYD